jgi:hypothetical protein
MDVESASAAYFGITVAPHEYFDHTGSRVSLKLESPGTRPRNFGHPAFACYLDVRSQYPLPTEVTL